MTDDFEMAIISVFKWIDQGFGRPTCVRFLIAEGYSEEFAMKVYDEAVIRLSEAYG